MMGEAPAPEARKYLVVAAMVRAQVADGTLKPGAPAPSGRELSRVLGYSELTCLTGLRCLVKAGVLTHVAGSRARFRVPVDGLPRAARALAAAEVTLSGGLAVRRRALRLSQAGLASRVGVPGATVAHAETRRLWQPREFWERADTVLCACGELLRLHDAYLRAKAAAVPKPSPARVAALTSREREVAVLYAVERRAQGEIAAQLGISVRTVQFHVGNARAKAGTGAARRGSRLRLALWLRRQGAGVPGG
jgi:DNA-binding CsgD family transcriptional regulator